MEKVVSYIGFAIKSGSCLFGQTTIKSYEKDIELILVCNSASDNLKDLAKNVAKKKSCPLIETKLSLEDLTNRDNTKIIAITDKNLSKAILDNKENISID